MVGAKTGGGAVHLIGKTGDIAGRIDQFLGVLKAQDLALIQNDDFFHHIGGFLDDVGGDHEGTAGFGVLIQQQLVELLPCHHVQTGDRLIQEGELCLAGQSHDDGDHGEHTLAELAELLLGL